MAIKAIFWPEVLGISGGRPKGVAVDAHGTQHQATKLGTQVRGMLKDDDDGRAILPFNFIDEVSYRLQLVIDECSFSIH